jgi:hypothetical protein
MTAMAITTQEIPRDEWGPYFDEFSRNLGTVEATVEIEGRDLGAQIAADRLTLTGISYDHKDDVVVIGLAARGGTTEDYEHLVSQPQRIFVATSEAAEMALDIEDAEGHKTIVRLRPAPALTE